MKSLKNNSQSSGKGLKPESLKYEVQEKIWTQNLSNMKQECELLNCGIQNYDREGRILKWQGKRLWELNWARSRSYPIAGSGITRIEASTRKSGLTTTFSPHIWWGKCLGITQQRDGSLVKGSLFVQSVSSYLGRGAARWFWNQHFELSTCLHVALC